LRYDLLFLCAYVVQHQNDMSFRLEISDSTSLARRSTSKKGDLEIFQCDANVVGSTSLCSLEVG
jgi:hypothetical protein